MNPFANQIAAEKYRDLLSNSQNQRMINLLNVDRTGSKTTLMQKIGELLIRVGRQLTLTHEKSQKEHKRVHPFRRVL